jgi:endoglucanase
LRRCTHSFWTEEILTNNSILKPGLADAFGVIPAHADTMVWDVTSLMREELLGDDWLSLAITGTAGSNGYVVFHSKEANNAANHPELVLEFAPTTLPPIDDAYVRSGIYANDNFGASIEMVVKDDPNIDYDRTAYLKFDVSEYAGTPVRKVLLHVDKKAMTAKAHLTPYAAYAVDNDTWNESTITFNNKPTAGTTILSAHYGRDAMNWDVTSAFNQAKESDGTLSLELKSLVEGPDRNVNVYTKEFSDPTKHPRLVVSYDRDLPDAGMNFVDGSTTRSETDLEFDLSQGIEPLVYPNPTKDMFRVVMPTSEPATLLILSSTGILVGAHTVGGNSEQEFSTADLPSGLYFIRIVETSGKHAWTIKLVRQ